MRALLLPGFRLSPFLRFSSLFSNTSSFRRIFTSNFGGFGMGDKTKRAASYRLCNVSGYETDLLEIRAKDLKMHVVFIPGNPGVVSFYEDFLESVYDLLQGIATVTAIGHISHSEKNREDGRLFSLQAQTDHKILFIQQELQNAEVPIILVGHSIGSYISIEIFRRFPLKVRYCIGLYPFLAVNSNSRQQSVIKKISTSQLVPSILSSIVALLGLLPVWLLRILVRNSIGKSWSDAAVMALCAHVLKYHTIRNVLYMAKTEFEKLAEVPNWAFMEEKQNQLAFLFGVDDHWGPLQMLAEISKKVPGAVLEVEREGHSHAFACTEAGSLWVARHVVSLIQNQMKS